MKPAPLAKPPASSPAGTASHAWWIGLAVVIVGGGIALAVLKKTGKAPSGRVSSITAAASVPPAAAPTHALATNPSPPAIASATETNAAALPTLEAIQSVVVTQDLDFGAKPPGLAEVMQEIDRRSQPDDGRGRTFAILEAFNGEVQPDGKVRVSLRVSTEKPGLGEIVFRRTGQVLWKTRITPATRKPPMNAGALMILFDNGEGKTFMVDGSAGPSSILEAPMMESPLTVAQAWPDGASREITFIYSACGCPVKVTCRREGSRTVRTQSAQVIFPDDPAAVQVINSLMGWK